MSMLLFFEHFEHSPISPISPISPHMYMLFIQLYLELFKLLLQGDCKITFKAIVVQTFIYHHKTDTE